MQRHLSTGSATLAALMEAHRQPLRPPPGSAAKAPVDIARLLAAMADQRFRATRPQTGRQDARAASGA